MGLSPNTPLQATAASVPLAVASRRRRSAAADGEP